ncbi:MAG TPA: Crp/Fnr family transcriptional regulator [Williamwhitmania sp.]|nr:Crp/Fnr family transcriptional regulator [Williamwhitmania sp.]
MKISCNSEDCRNCSLRSTLFRSLTTEELMVVEDGKEIFVAGKGEVIAKQGDLVRHFIYLRDGLAKLSRRNTEGHEQIIGIASPLDFIGLLSLFSSSTYQYTITAIEDTELCMVNIGAVEQLVLKSGTFARTLLEKMSIVSNKLLNTRLELNTRQLRGRIAFIILMFADDVYKSNTFSLPISRKEIGDLIDMRVENVIRSLSEFRKDGIIRIEGTTIEILDKPMLEWLMLHG